MVTDLATLRHYPAICLINVHLLIADNRITHSSDPEKGEMAYIKEVISYLSDLVSSAPQREKKEIIKKICAKKIAGEGAGYITNPLSDQELGNLVNLVSSSEQPFLSIDENMDCIKHSSPKIAAAIALRNDVVRRLLRVETFLNSLEGSTLKKAVSGGMTKAGLVFSPYGAATREDANWLASNDHPGCAIIATHLSTDTTGTVHGELKIIDYLLASRILTRKWTEAEYFIGISKRCCPDCYGVIESVNASFEKGKGPIKTSGSHQIEARNRKNWLKPIFLLESLKQKDSIPTYEQGLFLCKQYELIGYYVEDNWTYPIKNEAEINEHPHTYLYRDFNLVDKIQIHYQNRSVSTQPDSPDENDENMSQKTPDGQTHTINKKSNREWIQSIGENILRNPSFELNRFT